MSDLLVEKRGRVSVLTINRPESLNALSVSLLTELTEAIADFTRDPAQRVAIITGAGAKAFSAGADLKEMAKNVASGHRLPVSAQPDIAGIGDSEKPTIAAINGLAVAAGLELSLCCDIRICSNNAWFGVLEVKRGILAGVAVNVLPRLMPMGAVMDLMLSGDRLSADDAFRLGLVQKVTTPQDLMDEAMRKADMIASNSPTAVWGTKMVLKYWRNALLAEQHAYYQAVAHRVLLSGDVHEGPRAFAENREPRFSNGWPDPLARN